MAAAEQPSGLMDIARYVRISPSSVLPVPQDNKLTVQSTLTQDEIPFKLRCAICNKLAVNAFRLPCCEQAICETCELPCFETCLRVDNC